MGSLSNKVVMNLLGDLGIQFCGHMQVLACDYYHVVYLVDREEVE